MLFIKFIEPEIEDIAVKIGEPIKKVDINKNNIEGDFIECGVWKGGSIMTMIKTLQELNLNDRDVFLYDTFTGMSKPTSEDIASNGRIGSELYTGIPNDDPDANPLQSYPRRFNRKHTRYLCNGCR